MSKIVYVCVRDRSQGAQIAHAVAAIADRLLPDNIPRRPSRILQSGGIVAGISNPNDLIAVHGTNVAAGYLVDPGKWEIPGTGRPDGAYALFRSDDAVVEIVSDALASRTVWYAKTDDMFVASTSQRAIVSLLGTFELNAAVVPWMLASGTLGPGFSWDTRIRHVPGATTVTLDRNAWSVKERTEPTRFLPRSVSNQEHQRHISQALKHAVGSARVADARWAITLSGGLDSRAILCLLEKTTGLRAVTWGLQTSLSDPTNDAQIAARLARHFALEHRYFETDLTDEPVERLFERFIANGEGRVDHISGYADGFRLWGQLVEADIHGILRGDEAFGAKPVRTSQEARERAGLTLWTDYSAMPPLERFDLPTTALPEGLHQSAGESLDTWRDRLFQQFRIPFVHGSLSDLKLPYVEIISPLLSDSLIHAVRQLPDPMRTGKALFKQITVAMSPDIPFASGNATQALGDILRLPRVVELLRDSLSAHGAGSAIPREFAAYAADGLVEAHARRGRDRVLTIQRAAKALTPAWIRRMRANTLPPPTLDRNHLAFRAFLITRAVRSFERDAKFGQCLRSGLPDVAD
jgi:hypothetical protein